MKVATKAIIWKYIIAVNYSTMMSARQSKPTFSPDSGRKNLERFSLTQYKPT